MEADETDNVLRQAAEAAEEHLQKLELETARDLIRDALPVLPWELQEGYSRIIELNRAGKRNEASTAWEEWLATARAMNLI